MVDVILLERVEKLGQMGQVVKVRPGYARNYPAAAEEGAPRHQGKSRLFREATRPARGAESDAPHRCRACRGRSSRALSWSSCVRPARVASSTARSRRAIRRGGDGKPVSPSAAAKSSSRRRSRPWASISSAWCSIPRSPSPSLSTWRNRWKKRKCRRRASIRSAWRRKRPSARPPLRSRPPLLREPRRKKQRKSEARFRRILTVLPPPRLGATWGRGDGGFRCIE